MNSINKIFLLQSELNELRQNIGRRHVLVAEALSSLGLVYFYMLGDHDKALPIFYEALRIFEFQEQSEDIFLKRAFILIDLGNLFRMRGDYSLAKLKFLLALAFFQKNLINKCYPQAKLCKYSIFRGLAALNASSIDINLINKQRLSGITKTMASYQKNHKSSCDLRLSLTSLSAHPKKLANAQKFHSSSQSFLLPSMR